MCMHLPVRLIGLALVIGSMFSATVTPAAAQSQPTRRWLAEPARRTTTVGIGPRTFITDLAPLSAMDGWASAYGTLLHYDGTHWREALRLPDIVEAHALAMQDAAQGWMVGANVTRTPPYQSSIAIWRYESGTWQPAPAPALRGLLTDVAVFPGMALAIGAQEPDGPDQRRALVLINNGQGWRDVTPPDWGYGWLEKLTMISATEGWATGFVGQIDAASQNQLRAAIWHYRAGSWTEEPLLDVQPVHSWGISSIVMADAQTGWASLVEGAAGSPCPSARLLRYQHGRWQRQDAPEASGIVLGLIPGTSQGWASLSGCTLRGQNMPARRMRFADGQFSADTDGAALVPFIYGLLNADVQWGAAESALMRYSAETLPTAPLAAAPAGARFFPETGHSLAGDFRQYYETYGLELGDAGISARESLALFGYPISEPFDEVNPDTAQITRVQYFERARFELHPENAAPYHVLLGRLAIERLERQPGGPPPLPAPTVTPVPAGCRRFAETGYDLCPPLRPFWEQSGGLPVFGLPVSMAGEETSQTDGQPYLTQWFERERLEYHPELAGTPYAVLLGLLGSEELRTRGYLP